MGDLVDDAISGREPLPAASPTPAGLHMGAGWTGPGEFSLMSMSGGAGSTFVDNEQHVHIDLRDRKFYFDLWMLSAADDDSTPGARPRLADLPLHPGGRYRLRVSPSLDRYRASRGAPDFTLEQWEVTVRAELRLELQATRDGCEFASLTQGEEITFLARASTNWHRDLELEIPTDYRGKSLGIELLYREGGEGMPRSASLLSVPVAGRGAEPQPPQTLPLLMAPPRTAYLHVERTIDGGLEVFGGGRDVPPLERERIPTLRLRDTYSDPFAYQEHVVTGLHDYVVGERTHLVPWLQQLANTYGEDWSLVIFDHADSEIPWEMLRLDGGVLLGAQARVVRFAVVFYRTGPVHLQFGERVYRGRIAAFTDDVHRPVSQWMDRLAADSCGDLAEFQYVLYREGAPPVALAYLAHAGVLLYGDEGDALRFLRFPFSPPEPAPFDFREIEGVFRDRPLFFVNAPLSGRLMLDQRRPCGVARALLMQLAGAHIGTLGPVSPEFAAELVEDLLDAAASEGGVMVAEWLRRMRARAVERVRKAAGREERAAALQRRLYAFAYVYYGSPDARLQLTHEQEI